jgi:hypothetical protein
MTQNSQMQSSNFVRFQVLSDWHTLVMLLSPVDANPHPALGHLMKSEHADSQKPRCSQNFIQIGLVPSVISVDKEICSLLFLGFIFHY